MNAKGLMGFNLKVKIVSKTKIQQVSGGQDTVGFYDPDVMTIYIRSDLSTYWRWYYFFHECTHHVLYVTGSDQTLSDSQTENICQSVASMCMQLFPKILRGDKPQMREP